MAIQHKLQFKLEMSFHQLEIQAVLQDAHDTERIHHLLNQFTSLKQDYANAQLTIANLTKQLNELKETNKVLSEGRHRHHHSQSAKEDCFYAKQASLPFSQTSSYFHVQQTKRKVIGGFVAELTSQLENNEELLLRERRMMEQLRRQLQASHAEVLTLKTANRALENEMNALVSQNRQLLTELSDLQAKKDMIEGEMQRGFVEIDCRRTSLLLRAKQAEEEFLLMDQIYRQIEVELGQ